MRSLIPVFLLLLSACDSAPVGSGLDQKGQLQINGHVFSVYHNEKKAVVTRQSTYFEKDKDPVIEAGLVAAEQVSGCAIKPATFRGHSNQFHVLLKCSEQSVTAQPPQLVCDGRVELDTDVPYSLGNVDLTCVPQ